MKGTGAVFQRDFRELRGSNAFRIILILTAVITAGAAVATSVVLGRQEWLGEAAARPLLEMIIGLISCFVPLSVLLAFIWAFASMPIVKEKVNGNVECLLATPLNPKALWMGKSMAIFLPGFVISVASNLTIVLAVNLSTIIPATGGNVLPVPALVAGFIVNPLLLLGLLSFIVLFSLARNPDIAIAPSFIIGFGLMGGIILGMELGAINLASWSFVLWYLAGAVVAWVIVLFLSRLLTRENIVLSSKGD